MLPMKVLEAGSTTMGLRAMDAARRSVMSETDTQCCMQHPFSCIGDGLLSTSFRSHAGETYISFPLWNI